MAGVYNQAKYRRQKTAALLAWAEFILKLTQLRFAHRRRARTINNVITSIPVPDYFGRPSQPSVVEDPRV